MTNLRLRDLGIQPGSYPPGPLNAITDVAGVLVGQTTLITDTPFTARTGVTVIFPRSDVHADNALAGFHSFNGIGEMTGLPFIEETGLLSSPIVLTNTNQVGLGYDTVVRYGTRKHGGFAYKLPVIAETYDGWLSDINAFPLRAQDFESALETAQSGPVAEGNTGGGTGMVCHEFKGGTGTASRRVEIEGQAYMVGALVQANHGERDYLRVDGAPVGKLIGPQVVPLPWNEPPTSSSIIAVIATDAPLLPNQCRRLAQRATVGIARAGAFGTDGSGDLFLAFSVGNHYSHVKGLKTLQAVAQFSMDPLVISAAEAVEEAVLNALAAAETMTGYLGRTAYALPHDRLKQVMAKF